MVQQIEKVEKTERVEKRTEIGIPMERMGPEPLRGADDERFRRVLGEALQAIDEARVPHLLIGGIAATSYGRPRWTHDIDVFLRPEDAERALRALAAAGFQTEVTDPTWLLKGFKEDVMVDLIFVCTGGFHLDEEMLSRGVETEFQGQKVRLLPPEDLILFKAAVHDERGPRHWHDALGILSRADLDWDYLLRRARRVPRRMLSLLIYAHSIDLAVPNRVIRTLFQTVYGE